MENNKNVKVKKLPLDRTDTNNQIDINDINNTKNINSLNNINNINNFVDNQKNQNFEKNNQKKYAKDDLNIVDPQASTRFSYTNTYDREKEMIELKNLYSKSKTPPTFSNLRESQASSFYINKFISKENTSPLIRDKSAKFAQVIRIPAKEDIIDIFKKEKALHSGKAPSSYERLGAASTKKLSNNEYFNKIISQSAGTYKQNEFIVKNIPKIIEESYNNNFIKNSNISSSNKAQDMNAKNQPQVFGSFIFNKNNQIDPTFNFSQKKEDKNIINNDLIKDFYSSNINDYNLANNSMENKSEGNYYMKNMPKIDNIMKTKTTPLNNQGNNNDNFAEVVFLSKTKNINQSQNNEIKNINKTIDKKELPEVLNASNINNVGSFMLYQNDKDEFKKKDMNLPENNNLKESKTNEANEINEFKDNDLINSNKFATITKLNGNQFATKENTELFDYSNINNINNLSFSNDAFNIYNTKEEINKNKIGNEKTDIIGIPEIFDSFNINTLKQPTTTLNKIEDNFPKNFDSTNINNFNQTDNISSTNINIKDFNYDMTNTIIDYKNLPEIFGSSNINNKVEASNKSNEYNFDIKDLTKEINYSNINYFNQDVNTNNDIEKPNEIYGSFLLNNLNEKINSSKIIQEKNNNLNLNQTPTITPKTKKIEENNIIKDFRNYIQDLNIEKNNLPKVFSSSDITNYKQNINKNNKELNNFDNNMTMAMAEKIINMKDLPEVFGSSDINKKQKISASSQPKEEIVTDMPDVFGSFDINNISKDNNIKENEIINIKDLPEISKSYNISDLKQPTTTIINEEVNINNINNINKKKLPEVFPSSNFIPTKTIFKNPNFYIKEDIGESNNNNNINPVENTTTKKLDDYNIIKDFKNNIQNLNIEKNSLPKVYSSSDITNYKQNINKNNANQNNELNKIDTNMSMIEKIVNMKELPEVFGSSDIKLKHKISVSCQTEEVVTDLPDVFGSFDINDYSKDNNNLKENEIINIKDIDNLKQPKRTLDLTKEDIDKKDLSTDFISSNNNINQNTINEITLNINSNDLPEVIGSSDFNNFNQDSIIDVNKSIDIKDLPEVFGSYDINNIQKTPIALNSNIKESENKSSDLNQYGYEKEQNSLLVPQSRNKSYIKHIKQNIQSNLNPFDYKQSSHMKNSSSFSYYNLKENNNQSYGLSNLNQTSDIQPSRPTYVTQIENKSIENDYNPFIHTIKNAKSYQNININPLGNIGLKSLNNDKAQPKKNPMTLYKSISNNNFNNLRISNYSGTKYNTIYPVTNISSNNIFRNKNNTKRIFNKKNAWQGHNYTYNSPDYLSTNIIKTIYS